MNAEPAQSGRDRHVGPVAVEIAPRAPSGRRRRPRAERVDWRFEGHLRYPRFVCYLRDERWCRTSDAYRYACWLYVHANPDALVA